MAEQRKWFKGRAALELDAWYSSGEIDETLNGARDLLLQHDSFEELVGQLGTAGRWNAEEFEYPRGSGALQGPEFEAVARQGYLEAIALALEHTPPVPVRTFWMTGVGNETFEMHVTDETDRVSVTLIVPDVDGGSDEPGSPESWVARMDTGGNIQVDQTSGPRDQPQPSTR